MKRKAFVLVSILICSIFLNFTYANANGLNENSRKILKEGKWKNSKWEYYDNGEIVFYLGALSTVEEAPWNNGDLNKDDIRIINFSAKSKAPIDMSYLFSGFENLKEINNLKNLDVKETTNMSHLFDGVKVKEIDISRWKTGYLKDTSYMFSNIKNIEKLDVSNLHTNNVTNMSYMFADSNFEEIDLSNFNTGKVKDLNNIFLNTPYLNKLVLGTTFRFKGNTGLEKGINPYTDSWKGLEKEFLYPSTEEFIKKYDGNKPDTYCRVLEKYKVEFNNSFGKILDSQEVEYGSKLNKIENPEREGYKFTYWSTDKEGVNEFDFETPISKNTTLYAQWEKGMDVYKVTYDGNGATSGEVPTDNIDYGHGSLVTVKGNIGNLVRNDYIFDGWAKDPLGNDTVEDTFIITEDTTLYAQWVLDTSGSGVVYVTFEPNGGVFSDGTIESKVVEVAKGETVLEEDILKEGYIFKGWYLEDETKYNFELEVIENLKLFAKWEKDSTMPTEPSNPSEPTKPTEPTKPERPTPTIKEITLVGGRATLTERVESQLMDFVQYRLSGKDRYATSVAVAKEYSKSNIVLLASGEKYTDELTATVLANKLDAPIMLTRKDAIPAEVKAEINRLGATKVILIGGNASISEKVEKELANYTVERIGGPDRYDTAILVGNQVRNLTASKTEAILVDGTDFPDAIAMTSMGVEKNMPILLTKPGQLPASTAKTIEDWKLTKVTIGGGSKSVSEAVEKEVRKYAEVNRIAGADRYETSVLVAEQVYVKPKHVVIASGEVFPDAIVGAPYAAKKGYPIVLSRSNNISDVAMEYILGNR